MILEVKFLLTNFDSTAIFKTLHLTMNRINYYSEHFRGDLGIGGGGGGGGGGYIPGLSLTYNIVQSLMANLRLFSY